MERVAGGAESAGLCGFAKGETVTAGLAFPSSSLAKILFGQAEPAGKPPVFSINGRYNGKCGGQGKGLWMQAPLPGKLRGESPAALRPHTTPPRISTNAPQGRKLLPPAFYRTAAAALSGAMWKRKRLSGVGIQKRMREAARWRRWPGVAILRQRPAFVPLIRASTRSVLVYRAASPHLRNTSVDLLEKLRHAGGFPPSEKHLVQAALPLHWPKMRTPALRIRFRSASACWFEWLWAVGVGGGEASAPLIAPSKQTYILLLPYLRLARFASYCSAYFLKDVRYACPGLCACA